MRLDLEQLLLPIDGENPSGENLRYAPIYGQITEARKEQLNESPGVWVRETKNADWARVIQLSSLALSTRAKDLQLAVWLTEAGLRQEGIAGLRTGLNVITGLLERFWDTLYPEIEDGDAEPRSLLLEWVATRLHEPIKHVPLTSNGLDWCGLRELSHIQKESKGRRRELDEQIPNTDNSGLTLNELRHAIHDTPRSFCSRTIEELQAAVASVDSLDAVCRERFVDDVPDLQPLRAVLGEVGQVAGLVLQMKNMVHPEADFDEKMPWESAGGEDATGGCGSQEAGDPNWPGVAPKEDAPVFAIPPTFGSDRVYFTVTAPRGVTPGNVVEVLVWVHLASQREQVIERARDEFALRNLFIRSRGPIQVVRGSMLTVRLKIPGIQLDEPEDLVLWDGEIGCAGFIGKVPKGCKEALLPATAFVYIDGIQIGKVHFTLGVGRTRSANQVEITESKPEKAFASYAHDDRDEVLARLQGIQKAVPHLQIFFDTASLRSGQDWESALWRTISDSDIFYLFWSVNASKSIWVDKEWRYALQARGLDFIDPVPLQPPEEAPPPSELASKHFNDWMLAFMRRKRMTGTVEIESRTQLNLGEYYGETGRG